MFRRALQRPPVPATAAAPPRPGRARARAWLAMALALAAPAPVAARAIDDDDGRAVAPGVPEGKITEVRIVGNATIADAQIRAKLLARAGRPLDPATVSADIRSLFGTKWFSKVKAHYEDDPARGGYILHYFVEEMPLLQAVEFRGRTRKMSLKALEESTGLKPGARADQSRNQAAVGQIRRLYQEKGYELAEVKLIEGGKPGDRRAIFEIFEGPKLKVGGVAFEGNEAIPASTLRTRIKNGTKLLGLLPGSYMAEGSDEDARRLVEYYQDLGYFDARVSPVVRRGAGPGDLRVTFVVSEGVQYKVRNVEFKGNEKIGTDELRQDLVLHSGQPFSETLREIDATAMRVKYTKIGCIDVQIQPEPRFTETPGVVDLVYNVEEGDRYLLGAVNIRGNERTRDKVIRRELAAAGLLPGEPLDGTRIETARKRLGSLQFFVASPDMGKPIDLQISNRRSIDHPYIDEAAPDLDEIVRTRFQGPDDPPPIPGEPPAFEPFAPDDGPAGVVPFEPLGPRTLPVEPVPAPVVPVAPRRGGRQVVGQGEPPGTLPSLPGDNMFDVGPDRNEPFPNRSFSNIATQVEPEGPKSFADLDVNVQEAPTGRILLGVGASSFGGLSGNLILHERNFDIFALPRSLRDFGDGRAFRGAGQDLRIELSPGTLINRALISFREPALFDRPIGLSVSGYTFARAYPDYNEARAGGRFSLGKQFGTQTYADVAVRVEDVNVYSFRTPAPAEYLAVTGHTFLATIRPSVRFDNRNDPFVPTKGSYLEAAFEQGWGDFTFPKFTMEGRQHFTLGSRPDQTGKRLLTLRGFFGATGLNTPLYERFYAGDFRSMRGFAYRGVGPFIFGSNVGGVLSAVGSVEYQFPLTANDQLQAVVFSDFGTVENDYTISNFRASVGTGIRVIVPALGPLPLAFDIAFPLAKEEGDRERYFTFFIGAFW